MLSYRSAGLGGSAAADPALVRDLQADLRALGYLRSGIVGRIGPGTRAAIRRLQFDLIHNGGGSRGGDGDAPVRMTDFNRGVASVTVLSTRLADSIETPPMRNARRACTELHTKFASFVAGRTPGAQADDRLAGRPALPLRLCRYGTSDPRFVRVCGDCAAEMGKVDSARRWRCTIRQYAPMATQATIRIRSVREFPIAHSSWATCPMRLAATMAAAQTRATISLASCSTCWRTHSMKGAR